jgi:hypothetical protein
MDPDLNLHTKTSTVARARTYFEGAFSLQRRLTKMRAAVDQVGGNRLSPVKREQEEQAGSTNPPRPPPQEDQNATNETADDGSAAATIPAACFSEDVPNDLFPVGRLIVPDGIEDEGVVPCVFGPVSGEPRLELTLDTFMTDICRTTEWFLATDADDTEASPQRAVLLRVTPINMDGVTFVPRHMAMDQEGCLRMTRVTVCATRICGHAPRWLLDDVSAWGSRWARSINQCLPNNATVYVRLGEVTRIRNWTQH